MYMFVDAKLVGINGLISLAQFARSEWESFEKTGLWTMHDCIKVPSCIESILVRDDCRGIGTDVEYQLAPQKRKIWFKQLDTSARYDSRRPNRRRYDGESFYLSELVDPEGHSWQFEFKLSVVGGYDKLTLVKKKSLDNPQLVQFRGSMGPTIRE